MNEAMSKSKGGKKPAPAPKGHPDAAQDLAQLKSVLKGNAFKGGKTPVKGRKGR